MPRRFWQIIRTLLIPMMFLVFTIQIIKSQNNAIAAQDSESESREKLIRLSDAIGVDVTGMSSGETGKIELSNGIQLERITAVDPVTRKVFSEVFLDGQVVDERYMREQAAQEWWNVHGALTPALVEKMAAMNPGDTIDVSLWLIADVQSLPKPELLHIIENEDGIRTIKNIAIRELSETNLNQVRDEIADYKIENNTHIQAQISQIQDRFQDFARLNGLNIQYASNLTPLVYLSGVTQAQLEQLARHSGVVAIYETNLAGGPSLNVARVTQTGDHVEVIGDYTGAGVNIAVVEGERVNGGHADLTVVSTRLTDQPVMDHPTHVGGIIASTNILTRGLASGANIYSANGIGYGVSGSGAALSEAMDWAANNTTILNHSFWMQDCGIRLISIRPFLPQNFSVIQQKLCLIQAISWH